MIKNRILLVAANGLGISGVPNVIYQVSRCLSEHYLVDLVVFNDEDFFKTKISSLGVNIIKVETKEPKNKIKRIFWRFFKEKRIIVSAFSNVFKKQKYDVVHSFREYESGYIFKCAKEYSVDNRLIHCNNEFSPPRNLFSRYIYIRKIKRTKKYATLFIGVSSTCCTKTYGDVPFVVLHNSYNESTFKLTPYVSKKGELKILQVATFSRRKNQLFTLNFFRKILDVVPNAKLYLVGTVIEKDYFELIKEAVKNNGLESFVKIADGSVGFGELLPITTYFVLPSLSEAAPITIVELQASGIKCFVSSVITKDVDCGGVSYLDLNTSLWAKTIIHDFFKNHEKRTMYDVTKFSSDSFNKSLLNYYSKF